MITESVINSTGSMRCIITNLPFRSVEEMGSDTLVNHPNTWMWGVSDLLPKDTFQKKMHNESF